MAGNRHLVNLGEVVDLLTGFPFKSEDYSSALSDARLLRGDNIAQGFLRWDGVKRWTDAANDLKKYWLQKDDVVLAMDRPWIEAGLKYASLGKHDVPALLVQRVARLRGTTALDTRFLKYIIGSRSFTDHVLGVQTGTAVPHISADQIRSFQFRLPPLAEQRAIAHILGTLDDKIELNRRMNETLEAMARALFKSWFVDFDPVRMKAEGKRLKAEKRPPAGSLHPSSFTLPPSVLDLFPDSFEDSELGEIPKGWKMACLDEEFILTMGQSPPGETYNDIGDGQPFYQGRADFTTRFPQRRIYCTAPTRLAKKGDTLVSVRAPVGDINMAGEDCAIGRGVAAIRYKSGSRSFTYYAMHCLGSQFACFEAEGTVFGSIGKKDFHGLRFIAPGRKAVAAFEAMSAPVDAMIERNDCENRTLATLRDALLPKLISGETRVENYQTT